MLLKRKVCDGVDGKEILKARDGVVFIFPFSGTGDPACVYHELTGEDAGATGENLYSI